MSNPFKIQFTSAGLAAAVSVKNHGLKAEITHIALGSGAYTPTGHELALSAEQQRVEIGDYQSDGDTVFLAAVFSGPKEYDIREMGVYLADGTLLGLVSDPLRRIGYKTAGDIHVQRLSIVTSLLPADSVTVQVGVNNLNLIMVKEIASIGSAIANLQLEQLRQADKIKRNNGAY